MSKKKETDFSELINDLENYSNNIKKNLASITRDELYECAKSAIDMFYADYEPVYYQRHFYNFEENIFKKLYRNPRNKIYSGGIEISSDEMDDIYSSPKDEVFDLVMAGYHGRSSKFKNSKRKITPVMNPSPMQIILNKQQEILSNIDSYVSFAILKAQTNGAYSILKF